MDIWRDEKPRRPFSIKTKRIEWLDAAGESGRKALLQYIKEGKIPHKMPTSQCRKCKRALTWGDRSYDFDHKDNNPANNSQKNCYLVCKICHGKATKMKVIKERLITGEAIGHKTIKLKVGYKKVTNKPAKKSSKKKKRSSLDKWLWG